MGSLVNCIRRVYLLVVRRREERWSSVCGDNCWRRCAWDRRRMSRSIHWSVELRGALGSRAASTTDTYKLSTTRSDEICRVLDFFVYFITALNRMQTRSSDENYVCPSVRLSVCLPNACIVTKRKKDFYTIRKII